MVLRRWPTWLALATAGVQLSDLTDGMELTFVLVIAGVGYLAVTVVDRPRTTWPLALLLLAGVVALRIAGVDELAVVLALGCVLAVAGLARGTLRRPGAPSLQLPAAAVFVATALVVPAVPPDVGLTVLAVGLIAHAAWDALHLWIDRIVVRSFAEWCGVLDLALGVGLLVLI